MRLEFLAEQVKDKFTIEQRYMQNHYNVQVPVWGMYTIKKVGRGIKSSEVGTIKIGANMDVEQIQITARSPRFNKEYDNYFKTILLLHGS